MRLRRGGDSHVLLKALADGGGDAGPVDPDVVASKISSSLRASALARLEKNGWVTISRHGVTITDDGAKQLELV